MKQNLKSSQQITKIKNFFLGLQLPINCHTTSTSITSAQNISACTVLNFQPMEIYTSHQALPDFPSLEFTLLESRNEKNEISKAHATFKTLILLADK